MFVLVDDDALFRGALAANLREDGCEVLEYDDGRSVPLDRLDGVEVLITDYLMRDEDGLHFAKRFHQAFPHVPIVIITAFATAHLESEVAALDYATLLHKPLAYEPLLHLLRQLSHHSPSPA
jgi:DNA-binding NtrC family response regulator